MAQAQEVLVHLTNGGIVVIKCVNRTIIRKVLVEKDTGRDVMTRDVGVNLIMTAKVVTTTIQELTFVMVTGTMEGAKTVTMTSSTTGYVSRVMMIITEAITMDIVTLIQMMTLTVITSTMFLIVAMLVTRNVTIQELVGVNVMRTTNIQATVIMIKTMSISVKIGGITKAMTT